MSDKFYKDNKFFESLDMIILKFEDHPRFGVNGEFEWPYGFQASLTVIEWYVLDAYPTTLEFLSFIRNKMESELEPLLFQLELSGKAGELSFEAFDTDSGNMLGDIFYKKESLKIKDWPIDLIVISALFQLVISDIKRIRLIYRKSRLNNPSKILILDKFPICFTCSIAWSNIFQLCVIPSVGPMVLLTLKELNFLSKFNIINTLIIPSIEHEQLYIPYDNNTSFFHSGLIEFLSLLGIDKHITLDLATRVEELHSIKPLSAFFENYKLELAKSNLFKEELS